MKKTGLITLISAAVIAVSGGSFLYADNFSQKAAEQVIEDIEYNYTAASEIDDYTVYIEDFVTDTETFANNYAKTAKCINKYGSFTLNMENGKIKKYKYRDNDPSDQYLVKGKASYTKKDITFDGYFIVDNTLNKYKKGQLTMYKGKLTLPNGDKFDGTLSKGKYYLLGTYTWKNGQSFKGSFTQSNNIGTKQLGENVNSEYGTFYFDSTKKTYLYIRFVEGVPRETGYYTTPSGKYKVTFNSKGVCISTTKVKK